MCVLDPFSFYLQDQEELDEARKISAFNRKRISGHVKILEDELMNDMHALEVCFFTFIDSLSAEAVDIPCQQIACKSSACSLWHGMGQSPCCLCSVQDVAGEMKAQQDMLCLLGVVQMNSDPKLEFELDSPVMQELEEPDANEILDKYKEELCSLMGIEGDEDWKVCSIAGIAHHPFCRMTV